MAASVQQQDPVNTAGANSAPLPPSSNGDSAKLMNGYSGAPTPPGPNGGGPHNGPQPIKSPHDTNGGGQTPPSSGQYAPESNGNGPASYGYPGGGYPSHNYGPYGPLPPGSKGGPPSQYPGSYPGPYGAPGGPTPTLNSLLQDRRYPGGGYEGGPPDASGMPPRGPPQGYGGGPWGYQHPGYRPQVGVRPQYGGYPPQGPPGGYPYAPRQPYPGEPRYPGEHPQHPGGYPGGQGPPPAGQPGGPQGQSSNSLDTDGGSDDGRPGSTEPANSAGGSLRGGPSPRPRPSPSPTGSSSSRSMSPAVPQQQPSSGQPGRPASRDSTNNGPTMSAAAMASPGPAPGSGYPPGSGPPGGPGSGPGGMPPNMGPPPHMYKGHGPPPPGQPPYGYPGYGAPPRGPGGYPPPGPYPGYPRNSSPGPPPPGQYQSGPYGPYPPAPWASQNGKGGPPGPLRHPSMGSGDPRMGGPPGSPYMSPGPGKGPYPGPPVSSYNGPQYNGPGMMPPGGGAPPTNGPPSSSPHPPGMGPPPPGSGYPPTTGGSVPPPSSTASTPPINSSAASSSSDTASDAGGQLVTTGPDGQPLHDESSQQSTLSQSSDNSGGRQTPKGAYNQGYPGTPHSAPSPGGSMGSSQDDPYQRDIGSPGHWGRVPPSPAGTPNPQQAKVENLTRLYEIDDNPERRAWLDKLLSFMEERGTPITQCPTISKNPLDLYRLYIYTRERGGYLETTNKKAWKDIAAQLGIGPSSSGAYTLKKHYGKNLLPYECRFDRGGIDPAPILAQVEAQSKKKSKSSANSVRPPSPGSQDSHDSMSSSQDGYGGYPGQYNSYPPPGQGPPHSGYPGSGYPGGPPRPMGPDGYPGPGGPPGANYSYGGPPRWPPGGQYGDGSGGPPPGGYYGGPGGYPPRPGGYPPSGPPGSGPPPPGGAQLPPSSSGTPPPMSTSGASVSSTPASSAPGGPPVMASSIAGSSTTTTSPSPAYPDYQGYAPPSSTSANSTGGMPPPPGGYPPKSTPLSVAGSPGPLGAPRPGGPPGSRPPYPWPPAGQYGGPPGHRPMYPGPPGYPSTSSPRPGGPPGPPGSAPPAWGSSGAPPYGGPPGYNGPPSAALSSQPPGAWGPPRHGGPAQMRPGYRPGMPVPGQPGMPRQMGPGRREMYNFPMESLECTQPLLNKRKKLAKTDVQPVDGWRLVLALRSGLLTESTWALDTLNILLYDDNSVTYFGLGNMPGLLEALIEHWRASLVAMFDLTKELELSNAKADSNRKRKRDRGEKRLDGVRWYQSCKSADDDLFAPGNVDGEEGLGSVNSEVLRRGDKVRILHHQPKDFTTEARFTEKDFQFDEKDDTLFVSDSERDWDEFSQGFFACPDLWAAGGGNTTDHIIPANCMQPELRLSFVRVMREDGDKLPRVKIEPASADSENVKSESSDAKSLSPNKKSRNSRGGVRESWKVSPTKGGEDNNSVVNNSKQNGPTSNSNDSLSNSKSSSNCNSNNSKHNANATEDSETKVKSEENGLKEEDCGESAVKKESSPVKNSNCTENVIQELEAKSGLRFKESSREAVLRRLVKPVLEEENYQPDHASLNLVQEPQDLLGRRGICVSTIFRNLSFVPGNEGLLGNNPGFLAICGKLLLHGHWHPVRNSKQRNYDKPEEEEDYSDSCTSLLEQKEWWWEHLQLIRENVLVALSNCSGYMDLSPHPEHIVLPLLAGLLEWAVSPSAVAQDPFPAVGMHSNISPQRLALETLCKLCVMEGNVDLILSTPPFSRLEQLCSFLSRKLYRSEDQVMREFAINLLYYFSGADSGMARTVAQQDTCVSLLVGFIEQVENNAMVVAQQHGVNALRDNPESMGTSLDMLRRAANTLCNLARHPDNAQIFRKQEQRLLNLVMSQILDQGVAGIISQVIFLISRGSS